MKRIVFLMTACKKSGPVQQMLNIIKHLDTTVFEPHLVTLYPEPTEDSQLEKYLPYVKHHYAPTGKIAMVLGRDKNLRATLDDIQPDVIHSLGVFPDFAVSRMKKWNQVITSRNFVYEDYPAKFGKIQGNILAWLHLYAMKRTCKTLACSESLSKIYKERLGLQFDFIRNGVDVEQYTMPTGDERAVIRKELKLPENAFIYVYTGQIIERKNLGFLLDAYTRCFKGDDTYLLVLGGGALLDGYKEQFGYAANVDFRGSVQNVNHYLKACDVYVSTSKSEGLPNGVLEAMATGLPVVLSDIEQHLEIHNVNPKIGFVYKQGIEGELVERMKGIMSVATEMGKKAYQTAHEQFSAKGMSNKYQELYKNIANK